MGKVNPHRKEIKVQLSDNWPLQFHSLFLPQHFPGMKGFTFIFILQLNKLWIHVSFFCLVRAVLVVILWPTCTQAVRPDWAINESSWVKFFYKNSPNIQWPMDLWHFEVKTAVVTFWATFTKKLGYFKFQQPVTLHSGETLGRKLHGH